MSVRKIQSKFERRPIKKLYLKFLIDFDAVTFQEKGYFYFRTSLVRNMHIFFNIQDSLGNAE